MSFLFWVGLWTFVAIALVIGWFLNIIAIVHTASDVLTGMFIGRVIGVFVPFVGGILGWF